MRNDGGCGRVAKTTAVKTLDSGPMGGLSGAAALARSRDIARMVTVDVGGTSADIGLVRDHRPVVDVFGSVHGLPLSFKFPSLRTAALGGGSVFQVADGGIQIGPESAGALPGPVCFGRGGDRPTLTDAALVAGYLDASRFAGGAIELQRELAVQAIADRIAAPLGLKDADAGAAAMIDAFASSLAEEITGVLAGQSWRSEDVVLVVFGGSGPLLACLVADRVGIREVIVPPASASFSALGVSFASLAHEQRAFVKCPVDARTWGDHVQVLRERASRDMFGEGVASAACNDRVRAYNENDGAEYVLKAAQAVPRAFREGAHRAVIEYEQAVRDSGREEFPVPQITSGAGTGGGQRPVLLGARSVLVPVIDAAAFRPGTAGHGPCVLESPYWSALLPAGWHWSDTELGVRLSR
jgi:N-methylhydantoinase A